MIKINIDNWQLFIMNKLKSMSPTIDNVLNNNNKNLINFKRNVLSLDIVFEFYFKNYLTFGFQMNYN